MQFQAQLNSIMASIRNVASGSYDGRYDLIRYDPEQGGRLIGAYGIPKWQWPRFASFAGIEGAPWASPMAQDYVAGHVLAFLFNRYGSWDLAAAAWYGGTGSADTIARRGYSDPQTSIRNPDLAEAVTQVMSSYRNVPSNVPDRAPTIRYINQHGWVFPVAGNYDGFSDSYGYQRTASQVASGKSSTHRGIDVYAAKGTALVAPVAGTIESSGYGEKGGHFVIIRGDDGMRYYFAHMNSPSPVSAGDRIRAGQQVGAVGNSGNAANTKPHLHIEMKQLSDMNYLNPYPFLQSALGQGGNNLAGTSFKHPEGGPSGAETMIVGLLESLANTSAGDTRVDYRTLGQQLEAAGVEEDETVRVQEGNVAL